MSHIFFILATILYISSCSENQFRSSVKLKKGEKDPVVEDKDPAARGDDKPIMQPQEKSAEQIAEMKRKCWFAVSGGWIGADTTDIAPTHSYNNWGSVFPATISGNPVGHGETFDEVGGVYLEARNEAYTSNAVPMTNLVRNSSRPEVGHEIDRAINWTFDSIAVAPGMHVVIKALSGNVVFETDGPFIGVSGEHGRFSSEYFQRLKASTSITQWMTSYLNTVTSIQQITGLHNSQSVQVRAIPGGECE